MTKSLTEKYRNKELSGWHYVKTKDGHICHWLLFTDSIEFEKDVEEVLAPVPSYDEYKELVFKANMPKNPVGDTIMCYDTERERAVVEKLQEQIEEANEALKYFAETTIGHKQKDGTYGMWLCSGEVAWDNPLERIKSRIDYVCYDPRPAEKYLKKWGVK